MANATTRPLRQKSQPLNIRCAACWKSVMKLRLILALCALAPACARPPETPPSARALSCEASADGVVSVAGAWLREQKDATAMSAAYFSICNGSMTPVVITGMSTPAAGMVEFHETSRNDAGIVSMGPSGELALKPGERVVFAPGGRHAMLMGLTGPISSGDQAIFDFAFADGSVLRATAVAKTNVEAAAE